MWPHGSIVFHPSISFILIKDLGSCGLLGKKIHRRKTCSHTPVASRPPANPFPPTNRLPTTYEREVTGAYRLSGERDFASCALPSSIFFFESLHVRNKAELGGGHRADRPLAPRFSHSVGLAWPDVLLLLQRREHSKSSYICYKSRWLTHKEAARRRGFHWQWQLDSSVEIKE